MSQPHAETVSAVHTNGQNGSMSPPSIAADSSKTRSEVQHASGVDELDLDFGGQSDVEPLEAEVDLDLQQMNDGSSSTLATAKLSTKKKEALSQVPCKFFRSNGCSAGNACPFAHIQPGEGQGKAVCQWFLKGNCRFGHRCALAHILPGQPMSMDRKNKRAAMQQQQNGLNGVNAQQSHAQMGGGNAKRLSQQMQQPSQHFSGLSREMNMGPEPLIRMGNMGQVTNGGVPYSVAAHAYPSFAREGGGGGDMMFGLPDDFQQSHGTSSTNQQRKPLDWQQSNSAAVQRRSQQDIAGIAENNTPAVSMVVGSPMAAQIFGTSPFSQPGSHSVFYSGSHTDHKEAERAFGRSQSRNDEDEALRRAAQRSWGTDNVAEEERAGEFLPSSLSDLLTPAELERRNRNVFGSKNRRLGRANGETILGASPSGETLSSYSVPVNDPRASEHWDQTSAYLQPDHRQGGVVGQERSSARFRASNTSVGFLSSRFGDTFASMENRRDADNSKPFSSFSPDARTALTHAPGQSLPQGLAAGLSRLHLRPETQNRESGEDEKAVRSGLSVGLQSRSGLTGQSASPGVIGGARLSAAAVDDLAPVAPSSIFPHRSTPLHHQLGRSLANSSSMSTSFDAQSLSHSNVALSGSLSAAKAGNGNVGGGAAYGVSPFAKQANVSPALRPQQGGIAIPNGSGAIGEPGTSPGAERTARTGRPISGSGGGVGAIGLPHQHKHPGLHRVRAGGASGASGTGVGASPLSLPTTGEEVEEAIFELE